MARSQKACQGFATQEHWLPIWGHDQASLVKQGNQVWLWSIHYHQARRVRLCWPDTSTEVEFYVQLKGKLTKKCYKCATVFVNHYSCFCFIHLQINNSLAETVAAKLAFEQSAAEHWVKVIHYHCINGHSTTMPFDKHVMMRNSNSPFVA